MRLREFDEKERLEKANEKLKDYKTAAGADATAADAAGNLARGNTRFKGINRATKKQFANDAKLAKLKEFAPSGDDGDGFSEETLKRLAAQWYNGDEDPRVEQTLMSAGWEIGQDEGYDNGGVFVVRAGDDQGDSYISWPSEDLAMNEGVTEGTDPKRDKAERMIWKYFGQIYNYGDDDGLNYLDEQGDIWNQLMDKYNGEIEDIVAQEPIEVLMQAAQELKGIAGDMKYELDEAAQGHTIEAHGVRGMDRRTWHKTFRNTDQMIAWAEKHDAEIIGTRDLEQARHHNLSPAQQGVAEGLTEMDKSQTPPGRDGNQQSPRDDRQSRGRDTGPRSGPDRVAKPVSKQKATRDMGDILNRAVQDSYKKEDVSEATDSATSNLIWKAMNYLPHDRPKDMEDILVQIAHNQGPVTRATDDPKKLASLVQMVWMDGQARKQKAGQQLDELSKDTLKDYMKAQPARIKGPAGLATTNPKKAARIVDPEKGDMRRALTKLKDPAYGQQGVTEDSISAMRRLAGIVTPTPAVVSNGQRQYRHMPTAVQPR